MTIDDLPKIDFTTHLEDGHNDYVDAEDIAFDPMDDLRHIIQCPKCKQDFEIVTY